MHYHIHLITNDSVFGETVGDMQIASGLSEQVYWILGKAPIFSLLTHTH